MMNIKRRTDEVRALASTSVGANMAFAVKGLLLTLALAFVAFNKECCAYNLPPPCPETYQRPVHIQVCFMSCLFLILILYPPLHT